ncbi:u6 snRNA-associated sm-like protein lsm6 [Anaeramoeba flamelloides]|uniref:U6 snRNA-associated sm-like protein lsm6 n=1 Tax=Anaeramoeba flamelloides TaxID=1746091 RepID=A0AAV8AGG7_9EUKA|nr:u6 snRNA-associated sm-like protein lsm6 [Anaeramoeba flamelloides]KAJ6249331.1 u6 snRNA-associated sm-like protein lsm6 [Anaeramoeba flamelloides]
MTQEAKEENFFSLLIGNQVIVKIESGTEFHGNLVNFDGSMNVALEHAEEWNGGTLVQQYGDIFIRGNNVFYITPKQKEKDKDKEKDLQIEN